MWILQSALQWTITSFCLFVTDFTSWNGSEHTASPRFPGHWRTMCLLSYDTVSAVAKKQQSRLCQLAARKRGRCRRSKQRFPPSSPKNKKKKKKRKRKKKKPASSAAEMELGVTVKQASFIQHRTIYWFIFNSRELRYITLQGLLTATVSFLKVSFSPKHSVQRMNGLFAPSAIQMFKSKILIHFIFSSFIFLSAKNSIASFGFFWHKNYNHVQNANNEALIRIQAGCPIWML